MTKLMELFADIADAIREVEGSAEEIPALEFPDRIRKLSASSEVDFTRLAKAIADATSAKNGAKVSGSGDYDFGTLVTTQAAIDTLSSAITAAQAVYDTYKTAPVSQDSLDAAQKTLDSALAAFNATLTPLTADKSAFTTQETRHSTLKAGVSVSADGKDVAFGGKWVTSAEQSAADTALSTARTAVNAATKQSQINAAVATFKNALDAYQAAIKTATKDTAALDAAIAAANAAKNGVLTSDANGSDLPGGSNYVTSAQMKAINDAIAAANTAKASGVNQNAIDAATSALTAATSTFSGQIKRNLPPIPQDSAALEALSWEEIAQLSADAAKNPASYLFMTDGSHKLEKNITMTGISGVSTVKALLIGVGQDVDENGNKLGFTFQLRDGLSYSQPVNMQMNSSNSTSGGWRDCRMRSTNLPRIEAALPEDLKSRLKNIKKKTNLTYSGSTLTETIDKLVLLSYTEVFGDNQAPNSSTTTWCKGEGEWYQWYESHNNNASRVINQASGSAYSWWLRSVYSSTGFGYVYSSGAWSYNNASVSYLPCACFSV